MPPRTLVCLANSLKGNGYCFAGVDLQTLEWVRPIGSGWHGAVMAREQALDDGSRPTLLDLIMVPLQGPAPDPGQPENWKISDGAWRREGRLAPAEASELLGRLVTTEWLFGSRGKALSPQEMTTLESSLAVVHPAELRWDKQDSKKLYAVFEHSGEELRLKVGDPAWSERFRNEPPGAYTIPDSSPYLVTSVTVHEFHGSHWKLVAGVIEC